MQPHPISPHHFILHDQLLGKGSTGNVYLGFHAQNPAKKTAIKEIDLKSIDNEVTKYLLSCQITALGQLSKIERPGNDHVVKLVEVVPQGHHIYLVMQLVEGGTLTQYLKKYPNGLPEEEAIELMRQILEGYIHISKKNIIHRDLKPDNILIHNLNNNRRHLVIIDFGYCEMEEVNNKPQMYYNVGSPKYMAPEAYRSCQYSQKSDVWAIGAIFYQMLTGHCCDQGYTMEAYLEMLQKKGVPLPPQVSNFAKYLLKGMMAFQSNDRLGCQEVMRQIIKYFRSKKQQSQQSEIIDENKSRKKNIVFQPVLIGSRPTPPKYSTTNNINASVIQTKETRVQNQSIDNRIERTLIRSRSSNFMPLNIVFNNATSAQNSSPKVIRQLKEQKQEINRGIKMEYYVQKDNQKTFSPKPLNKRETTPRQRFHFNFFNQPISPRKKHQIYQQPKQVNKIAYLKNNNFKNDKNDENSIKIHYKNPNQITNRLTPFQLNILGDQKYTKVSPLTRSPRQLQNKTIISHNKLVGGFTMEQASHNDQPHQVRRRERIVVMPQIICRQEYTDPSMRQFSHPRSIIYQ